ncbi:hypothetical protein FQR65_LT01428 [Abscondita terminalis]|nr:hypothetical protein FQR65_LT01428 [Abscondita terminalis]
MVVTESLRKWPTTVLTDRVCTKPYVIEPELPGEVPVYLEKGDLLWIPMYSIHRNLGLYPNPEDFDPERFDEQNKSNFNSYGYLPFGSGPRMCIANRFAKTEIKLLFLQILSKFDIVL